MSKVLIYSQEDLDLILELEKEKNEELQQENKQLKEQLLVAQTNEETFRLEMEDITQTLGLDEDTLFDDVKAYSRSLKDNWNKLKEWVDRCYDYYANEKDYIGGRLCFTDMKNKMQELEKEVIVMNKKKIIEILESYEFFVDDDFGGHYEHINCSQRALTPLGIVNILDYIENLEQLKEKVNKLEILIENLKLGVTLNQEQEDLLDEILFRESRE